MRLLIAGGTGFLGRALVAAMPDAEITVLSRTPGDRHITDLADAPHVDVVVNLAGESIQGRWTTAKKHRILRSRVDTTTRLVDWMLKMAKKPSLFLSSSAVGIYGDRGDELLPESGDKIVAPGFLPQVCRDWEQAAAPAAWKGVRTVLLRTGLPLDPAGGVLGEILPMLRRFPVFSLGNKGAWMPWIALGDWVRLVRLAIDTTELQGPLNLAAPNPVTQGEFTAAVAERLGKRVWGNVPAPLLRLGLGEFSEALLASQRVVPEKALGSGFKFEHPELRGYLDEAIQPRV